MRNLFKRFHGQEGFTLIELLVVVAIIALLAAFAVPKLFDAINKSKRTPGQADVQTLSGAMDRYYMDKNTYPYPSVAATADEVEIKDALTQNGYLKATTTFTNGFGKGYIYITNASGGYYVLIDAQNKATTDNLTLVCNAKELTVTTGDKKLNVFVTAAITADDVQKGCKLGTGTGASFAELAANSDGSASYSLTTN